MARKQAEGRRDGAQKFDLLRGAGGGLDLLASLALALLAGLAYLVLPAGSVVRVALTLPLLFFAPGYLLIEAVTRPATERSQRAVRAWIAIGVSPAVVALLALATAAMPGGFHAATIVTTITLTCLALAAVGLARRMRASRRAATTAAAGAV